MNDNATELQIKLRNAEKEVRAGETALRNAKGRLVKWSVWSALGGIALVAVGGQWFPGYQLDSTAKVTADKMAESAVSDVFASLCAERFMMTASGLESRLAAFKEQNNEWDKASYIREGTWADTPDGKKSDYDTAKKCMSLIADRISREKSSG